jgi:hypothetical protein
MLDFKTANLLTSAAKNDPSFDEFRRKISALVSENEAHASKILWVARMTESKICDKNVRVSFNQVIE